MSQDDTTNANSSRYASLTAGLLARKGEALPAAAAFTAEAIAQHIPARRLAQEAERELSDHNVSSSGSAAPETSEYTSPVEASEDTAERPDPDVAMQQQSPGEAFGDETGGKDVEIKTPSIDEALSQALDEQSQASGSSLIQADKSVDEAITKPRVLDLPYAGSTQDQEAASDDTENWFDGIVATAIDEAEGSQAQENEKAPGSKPGSALVPLASEASLSSSTFTSNMQSDRTSQDLVMEIEKSKKPSLVATSTDPVVRPTGGCQDKADKVREAIKSGNAGAASRSAMKLDPRRFIRLSLAARKLQLSNQDIMTAALDTYLDALDEEVFSDCSCMKKGLI